VFSGAAFVVSFEMLETVHPPGLSLFNGAIALDQVPKPHQQLPMHSPQMAVRAAVPASFELLTNVIWVKILGDLPVQFMNQIGRLGVIVMNDAADVLIAYPAWEEALQSLEFHSIARSLPITWDAALCLSDDLVINNFLLPGIDDSDDAFLGAPPVTPCAVEGNDRIRRHLVPPVLTFLRGCELNWPEKVLLSFVNARSSWEIETTPHKNVVNRLIIGAVDKNRKGEAVCIGIWFGAGQAGNEGSAAS
jgi:hypothetical protein